MKYKLKLVQIIMIWALLLACNGKISAQEVVAQWNDYPPSISAYEVIASEGNEYNKNIATLQRISNNELLRIATTKELKLAFSTKWDSASGDERYWIIKFSTKQYKNLKITSNQQSSPTGPKDFTVQYKTERSEWKDIAEVAITSVDNLINTLDLVPLPPEVNNQETVSVRWLHASNEAAEKGKSISPQGTNHIEISIYGERIENIPPTGWQPKSGSTDWNDPENWDKGLPDASTNVVISSGWDTYPIVQKGTNAVCDTIFFRTDIPNLSGELVNACFLQYNAVVVELLPSTNEYHLISPPLGGIYSGDFFTKGSFDPAFNPQAPRQTPAIWMKLYQSENPQTKVPAAVSGWSGYFNTLDYKLPAGSGVCIWVDDDNLPEGYDTHDNLTIRFPNDSLRFSYYDKNGRATETTDLLDRDKQSRFVYETLDNYNPEDGSFEINVVSDLCGERISDLAIVGNPFMCHLNFSKFQAENSDKIKAEYRIWGEESSGQGILYGGDRHSLDEDVNNLIAPLQAFLVLKNDEYGTTRPLETLKFTIEMCESSPGMGLRSASLRDEVPTHAPDHKTKGVKIIVRAKEIQVRSSEDDPIERIDGYDLQGKLIFSEKRIQSSTFTINTPQQTRILTLKVITRKSLSMEKVVF